MDWINLTQDKDKYAVVTFLDWLRNYQLLKKDSAPCSSLVTNLVSFFLNCCQYHKAKEDLSVLCHTEDFCIFLFSTVSYKKDGKKRKAGSQTATLHILVDIPIRCPTGNKTTTPQASSLQPHHYTDCAIAPRDSQRIKLKYLGGTCLSATYVYSFFEIFS